VFGFSIIGYAYVSYVPMHSVYRTYFKPLLVFGFSIIGYVFVSYVPMHSVYRMYFKPLLVFHLFISFSGFLFCIVILYLPFLSRQGSCHRY
jgi:hypothetical protein